MANDRPPQSAASWSVIHEGYGDAGVASTVGLITDRDAIVVTDPGMVRNHGLILEPLVRLGVQADDVTDVIFSHHHPDHTLSAALFANARFHDHWAIYRGDEWTSRDAEGYALTGSIRLIRTPGHTDEDITTLVGTADGVVAFTHLWNASDSIGDRRATDLDALHRGRARVLAVADIIVPGHGSPFVPTAATPR
ncbi:MAG: hypothetical protein QOF49_312 [Chloroflexota bacterium]|jgi:glyoxylase-like metal-dependent hydrolase (beta-lactamase superfamily II)|nr:hypothetical protein [Chloroflexota bacterium]